MTQYVANARMYSVSPSAAAAWRDLFTWLSGESGIDLRIIDHPFPLPLADLWSREDLACAFMCGFPFVTAKTPPKPVAAPVPFAAASPGRPVYASHLIVRADSGFASLEDTFGGRLGYTVEDSQSGYNALRRHLLPYRLARGGKLFSQSVGPLYTPRRVIEAVLAGTIDIGPLDAYAFDLLQSHDPNLVKPLRILATTEPAPIPFFVASPGCPDTVVASLQATFCKFADADACAGLRERLRLRSFSPVAVRDYDVLARWEAEARAAGYDRPN